MNFRNFAILYSLSLKYLVFQKLALEQNKSSKKKRKKFEMETTLIILCQSFFPEALLSSDTMFFEMKLFNI